MINAALLLQFIICSDFMSDKRFYLSCVVLIIGDALVLIGLFFEVTGFDFGDTLVAKGGEGDTATCVFTACPAEGWV